GTTWSEWNWRPGSGCLWSHCGHGHSTSPRLKRTQWGLVADLERRVVAFLEGRRTAELADLIGRHNGVPLAAPCLREVHRPEAASLQQEIARVCDADVGVAIFLTGVGTTTVFNSANLMGREADL